jgi:hypothetical protein
MYLQGIKRVEPESAGCSNWAFLSPATFGSPLKATLYETNFGMVD